MWHRPRLLSYFLNIYKNIVFSPLLQCIVMISHIWYIIQRWLKSWLTSRSPLQRRFGWGAMNRRSPTGGSAKGMLAQMSTWKFEVKIPKNQEEIQKSSGASTNGMLAQLSTWVQQIQGLTISWVALSWLDTSLLRELNFLSPLTRPVVVLTTNSWEKEQFFGLIFTSNLSGITKFIHCAMPFCWKSNQGK